MSPRLTYANVVSTLVLALVVTGGGVAVAGGVLKKNSVGSAQIRNGQVKTQDLAKNSVRGAKVADDSLTGADIREDTLDLPAPPAPPPASFVVVSPAGNEALPVPTEQTTVASLTITAPADGVVVVTAQAEFKATAAPNGYISVSVVPDGDESFQRYFDWDAGDTDAYYDQRQSLFASFTVEAGTHTYELTFEQLDAATTAMYYGAQLMAQWTAAAEPEILRPGSRRGTARPNG
ncbi:hypothetical protein BH11ACT8_BH11ACT8_29580 [soil metagenome]